MKKIISICAIAALAVSCSPKLRFTSDDTKSLNQRVADFGTGWTASFSVTVDSANYTDLGAVSTSYSTEYQSVNEGSTHVVTFSGSLKYNSTEYWTAADNTSAASTISDLLKKLSFVRAHSYTYKLGTSTDTLSDDGYSILNAPAVNSSMSETDIEAFKDQVKSLIIQQFKDGTFLFDGQ